jgi:1,4-dihydroxy-2-naphthoate octaprenyltransferase
MNINTDILLKIIKLGRPQFLVGGFLLFCIGALLAVLFNAEFVLNKFILGYATLFAAHLAVHYSNDYFDVDADQYVEPTAISGGSGILVENSELKQFSKWFAVSLIILSLILAAIFTIIFSYTIWFFLFVLFGNLLAWFYSAPPIKLVYHRLGEISTVLTGIILPGMGYFTIMGTLNLPFIIFAVPLAFFQLFFINSVEMPDMEGDKLGGKITLIVSLGRAFGFKLITFSAFLITISFLIIPYSNLFPPSIDFRILALISLIPLTLGIVELQKTPIDRESATKYSSLSIASLFAVGILVNLYFIYLIK